MSQLEYLISMLGIILEVAGIIIMVGLMDRGLIRWTGAGLILIGAAMYSVSITSTIA